MQSISNLNALFAFCELPFTVTSVIIESGQRTVYQGCHTNGDQVVVKMSAFNEIKIGRIQREVRILTEVNSGYFPRFRCHAYVSKATIENYIDNLDPSSQRELIDELKTNPPKPCFVTCEEFIQSIGWPEFQKRVGSEDQLVEFTTHVFNALKILWEKKIVHRDIKPDNILITPDLRPDIHPN